MTDPEVSALRREQELTWTAHQRQHEQHTLAHDREHGFAEAAIEKAATLAKENKADANEWRAAMTDREKRFATTVELDAAMARIDAIERAGLVASERERSEREKDAEDRRRAEQRISRSQWTIGTVVGLLATTAAILVNLVIRLAA